jgi:putative serine protease PepD
MLRLMLTSALKVLRRHGRVFAPLAAALGAAAIVAGIALATSSTGTNKTIIVTTSSPPSRIPIGLAASPGAALQSAIVDVVRSVSPSVVQIEDQQGLGSGIVLDAAGHIVTNNHVVSGTTSFTVTTSNGTRYPARLVGTFPPDDLAVIKISGAHLKPATFGDSSRLQVGDLAIAIGNPLGLRSSVTDGIVSAFRMAVPESNDVTLPSVIQTSAAINPGNSGGALADIEGRVIGIPTLAGPIRSSAVARPASVSRSRATSSRTSPAKSSATARWSTRTGSSSASRSATRTDWVPSSAQSRRVGLLPPPGCRSER